MEELVHDGRTEQRVARRARILLAMTDPDTVVQDLAERFGLDRTSIWACADATKPGGPWRSGMPLALAAHRGSPPPAAG